MSTGHIRRRGKNSWELKFDIGRHPKTGRRQIRYRSFKGTKREAQAELTLLMAKALEGAYVDPSKVTVATHVRARINQWEGAGDISPKTAERYRELLAHQIEPFIGAILIQKLRAPDIEVWHSTLRKSRRKDGKGGVSSQTDRRTACSVSPCEKRSVTTWSQRT
jgi:integrase